MGVLTIGGKPAQLVLPTVINPEPTRVLAAGQEGYFTATGLRVIGDGVTAVSALSREPKVLYRTVTQVTFPANNPTQRTVMSYTVPAGALANNGDYLTFELEAEFLLNAASSNWTNFYVSLGGATIMHSQWGAAQSATPYKCNGRTKLTRITATSVQGTVEGKTAASGAASVGQGGLAGSGLIRILSTVDTPPACNWGIAQDLVILFAPTADANISGLFWSGSISLNK